MVEEVTRLNDVWQIPDRQVQLKVGVHEGPALAISANDRLDYLGQTTSDDQHRGPGAGGAQGREISLTESTYRAPGVAEVFREAGYLGRGETAYLKGVAKPVDVYRLHCQQPSASVASCSATP